MKLNFPAPSGPRLGASPDEAEFSSPEWSKVGGKSTADAVEGFKWLTVGVQRFASTAPEALRSPDRLDPVHLVGFGERRKAQDLPRLLREHVADEVVLVQPLHDDDDRAVALVVQSAVESVVVPLVGGFALRLG